MNSIFEQFGKINLLWDRHPLDQLLAPSPCEYVRTRKDALQCPNPFSFLSSIGTRRQEILAVKTDLSRGKLSSASDLVDWVGSRGDRCK